MYESIKYIKQLWSCTNFGSIELNQYAEEQMLAETRKGVMAMCLLSLVLIIAALPLYFELKLHPIYLYTYLLVAALSIHIFFSARKMGDIKILYLLGITLLTISATAFVSIAHQTSSFSVLLFANVVLLFMIVPMVPWGIREASLVIFIIYSLLTLSTGGMSTRFGTDTLMVLQFFMIAAAITSIILVARSVQIRKEDMSTRFDLEQARAHLYNLSNLDPLTGAWNRRYLPTATIQLINDHEGEADSFHYILFDIDDFKTLNDSYGHDYGDKVLKCIGETFIGHLNNDGCLIRLGGDEFALLLVHDKPNVFVKTVCAEIEQKCREFSTGNATVKMSYGMVSAPLCSDTTLTALYLSADKAMYKSKEKIKSMQADKPLKNVSPRHPENESCNSSN